MDKTSLDGMFVLLLNQLNLLLASGEFAAEIVCFLLLWRINRGQLLQTVTSENPTELKAQVSN